MGFQQASPSPSPQRAASPPSGAASKSRRPSSLSVGSSTSSKTSPGRPSPVRSPVSKRGGSVNKASTPPGKALTCAQGPVLATEARSKVRPCGCSRRHGAGHHHPPETPKESPRRKPKNETPVKSTSLAPSTPAKPEKTSLTPLIAQSEKAGMNRYISTLVWVPRQTPSTYSTTIVVSAQDPAFSEIISIKHGSARAEARKH